MSFEQREALLQTAPYAGFSAANEALQALSAAPRGAEIHLLHARQRAATTTAADVDILANNAGVFPGGPTHELGGPSWWTPPRQAFARAGRALANRVDVAE